MAISFICGNCSKPFHVGQEMAGKTGRCKRCGRLMLIPFQSTDRPVRTWAADAANDESAPPARSNARAVEAASPPLRPRPAFGPGPAVGAAPAPAGPRVKSKRRKRADGSAGRSFAKRYGINFWSVCGLIGLMIGLLRIYNNYTGTLTRALVSRTASQYDDKPIELPPFPDPGPGREIEPGVMVHEVVLGPSRRSVGGKPGHGGKLWLYLPSGGSGDRSLPCILIAGAGSPLIHGMALEEGDRPSHLPFARAGFAVLAFELDGPLPDRATATDEEAGKAMLQFRAARAGLVNAHIALEYALRKVPAVDPSRISIAGHSSAGTLAVLFAETDPRLRSAVAFAPAVDVAQRFNAEQTALLTKAGFDAFFTKYSPMVGVANLRCPLFLFQARDDTNTPASEADAFVHRAQALGKEITYDLVERGDHAGALLSVGFPHAIAWLKGEALPDAGIALEGGPAAAPPADNPRPAPRPNRRSQTQSQIQTQSTQQNGRRIERRTEWHTETRTTRSTGSASVAPPAAAPLPTNPVERERALFEAAKRRRDAQRQKTLGRGATSGDGAEATNPP